MIGSLGPFSIIYQICPTYYFLKASLNEEGDIGFTSSIQIGSNSPDLGDLGSQTLFGCVHQFHGHLAGDHSDPHFSTVLDELVQGCDIVLFHDLLHHSSEHPELGELVGIDGSLIDAVLSMYWADYRKGSKKAKVHVGFDLNRAIPRKIFLTHGNGAERPFVSQILAPGQTGVMDRGYQCHKCFDLWQQENKFFACRIKASTKKTCSKANEVDPDSIVFYDAMVLLGTPGINQTEKELRLVGYIIDGVKYWVATNRYDLSAEQIALVYKLRWSIENFFAWWKRHLKVYHLIARSEHGLMVQILAGLITYLLLAIYCYQQYNEKVSIKRVRELRIKIQNETRMFDSNTANSKIFKEQKPLYSYAKT